MANIYAQFKNNYSESRKWVIIDLGRDPNAPPVVFNDYLDPNGVTDALQIYSSDGTWGKVQYQRSDGPAQVVDDVTDGSTVSMS